MLQNGFPTAVVRHHFLHLPHGVQSTPHGVIRIGLPKINQHRNEMLTDNFGAVNKIFYTNLKNLFTLKFIINPETSRGEGRQILKKKKIISTQFVFNFNTGCMFLFNIDRLLKFLTLAVF